jgi:SP family general alpha glucoside:H+ symporter-like MFS transporter
MSLVDRQEYEYAVVRHGIDAELAAREAMGGASFFEIFNKNNWRRTLAGCVGICSQWAAGAPIVFGYSTVSEPIVKGHKLTG